MSNYSDISKEVGFVGFRTYPTIEDAKKLLGNMVSRPNLENYKEALSLFRFLPEAKDQEQMEIVSTLNDALAVGTQIWFAFPEATRPNSLNYFQLLTNPYKALRAFYRELTIIFPEPDL
ncbi:MAG: hypothetical protein OER04_12335 [Cyclobacteriaceae bacterium]|nr:hypothetical protein [Cyclobacteriaceae bacterium]